MLKFYRIDFRFSCLIFCPFAEHLVGYISVGKVFWKAYRMSWFERPFFPTQGAWQSRSWLHKLMTSHAVQGMRICKRMVTCTSGANGLKHHGVSKLFNFILCSFLLVSRCYMLRNIFVFKILLSIIRHERFSQPSFNVVSTRGLADMTSINPGHSCSNTN